METFDVVLLARIFAAYGRIEALKAEIEGMKTDGRYTEKSFENMAEQIRGEVTSLELIARG